MRSNAESAPRIVQRTASNNLNVRGTSNRNAATTGAAGRVSARGAVVSNAMRGGTSTARTGVVSNSLPTNTNRSATSSASRAASARATAVFSDVSKIGGGYANCREAYATCMDQFCANANDTYRRCFCSSKYTEFRDTEDALDRAKTLLMQFEDNNLNAVDKTAAEVNAMYSATVGEAAIKSDTSGAAKILDEISDLLSGKKTTTTNNDRSLGLLSIDAISGEIDDVWGDTSSNSIFSSNTGQNLSEMEGTALYNASNRQCLALVGENCSSDAVLQMARSSYSIMITQDCNAYEKKINSQREAVKQTVRTAEKYLRDARLEEYRDHNSADVNECIAKVRSAVQSDSACGSNYKRCLDNTGAYINVTTGEPIYSPRLFQLTDVIKLGGTSSNSDVLTQNQQFSKFLDEKRVFAESALDTCRDKADTVWNEFKRAALIEIAQAQDEKIEEVKMSCVSTMADCYDTTTNALKDFDTTTSQAAGAVGAYAARQMCQDKVMTCAALYGNTSTCTFDNGGKFTGDASKCGLEALLAFVSTVDTSRVTEACEVAVDNFVRDLCTPTDGVYKYPYNCRTLDFGKRADYLDMKNDSLYAQVGRFVDRSCTFSGADKNTIKENTTSQIMDKLDQTVKNIKSELGTMLGSICTTTYGGIWSEKSADVANEMQNIMHNTNLPYNLSFYADVFGGRTTSGNDWGVCINNSIETQCQAQDTLTGNKGYAKYDETTKQCVFTSEWYSDRCAAIDGYGEDGQCFIAE